MDKMREELNETYCRKERRKSRRAKGRRRQMRIIVVKRCTWDVWKETRENGKWKTQRS